MVEATGWWTGFGGCVIWPLRVVLSQKTKSAMIVPMYKGKGEGMYGSNYRGIRFSMVGKICRDPRKQSM